MLGREADDEVVVSPFASCSSPLAETMVAFCFIASRHSYLNHVWLFATTFLSPRILRTGFEAPTTPSAHAKRTLEWTGLHATSVMLASHRMSVMVAKNLRRA